jgi:hypothetical protein
MENNLHAEQKEERTWSPQAPTGFSFLFAEEVPETLLTDSYFCSSLEY